MRICLILKYVLEVFLYDLILCSQLVDEKCLHHSF